MVSTGSPPVPLPVQVPPGHVLQQIVDERGTLRHVILSPAPAAAPAASHGAGTVPANGHIGVLPLATPPHPPPPPTHYVSIDLQFLYRRPSFSYIYIYISTHTHTCVCVSWRQNGNFYLLKLEYKFVDFVVLTRYERSVRASNLCNEKVRRRIPICLLNY